MIETYLIDKLNNGQEVILEDVKIARIRGHYDYVGQWVTSHYNGDVRPDCRGGRLYESITISCDSVLGEYDPEEGGLVLYLYESEDATDAYETHLLKAADIESGNSLTVVLPAAAKYYRLRAIGNGSQPQEVNAVFTGITLTGKTIGVPSYMEEPEEILDSYLILEKTAGRVRYNLGECTVVVQSYGKTLLDAVDLNDVMKGLMDLLNTDPAIASCTLNSDYNFTDTSTHRYRYQAVFGITYYDNMV